MGIRFTCPNGHRLNVKESLAGKRALCPNCGAKLTVPLGNAAAGAAPMGGASTVAPTAVETPSTMIPVIESGAASTLAPVDLSFPSSATPVTASVGVDALAESPTATKFAIERRNRRLKQTKLALALLFTAVVLAIVLIWVLSRGSSEEEASETAARRGEGVSPLFVRAQKEWGKGSVPFFSEQKKGTDPKLTMGTDLKIGATGANHG
jgi:hypothetical protein